jgi:tripartite-type tricarboxylate transporter receptor subunit TctC
MRILIALVGIASAAGMPQQASAQNYPERPIRVAMSYAGGCAQTSS